MQFFMNEMLYDPVGIKLESRTYVVDDVSSNRYGMYLMELKEMFQAGDMDILCVYYVIPCIAVVPRW